MGSKGKKSILFTLIIGLFVFGFILTNHKASQPASGPRTQIVVTDREREIFYKYFDFFSTLPVKEIEDTTNHKQAISMTAKEFGITDTETEQIYRAVEAERPTEKEFEIFNTYDQKLNEAIDASTSEIIDEDAIRKAVAGQFNIPIYKIRAIYVYVQAYKLDHK